MIGGTKGNVVLEFVSGAPNKEQVLERSPNALDYDELTKYGYGHLVTPIMKLGGRYAMYELLDLDAPETPVVARKSAPTEIVIDRTGENDPKRYKGLKLGQVLDDSLQGEALQNAMTKQQSQPQQDEPIPTDMDSADTEQLSLQEEYEIPFADKRNVGPRQTPDWTPERLDEWGKAQGRVEAWARKAKAGEFVSDPNEALELTLSQQCFSILTALIVTTAFGKATPAFLVNLLQVVPDTSAAVSFQQVLQGPAIGLLVASVGSAVYSNGQAKAKNRNTTVWSIKGWLGGPFTIATLRSLDPLLTRQEQEQANKATSMDP